MYRENSSLYRQLIESEEVQQRHLLYTKRRKYQSIIDRYKLVPSRTQQVSNLDGDATLERIQLFLNRLYRSPQQKEFHNAFLGACLRIIYGDSFQRERHRVVRKYEFESRKQQVLVCAPRRMGKTFSTAYFAIAMCLNVSGLEISIFSPGKRQSVALMGHICDWLYKLGEIDRIVRRNEEKLVVRSFDGKTSKINAYPSAVKTLKGVSGTIVILEEMAQIPVEVLFEVVVPLHQLDVTTIIGISTITDDTNFMTKYLEKKDSHGELLFAVKQIFLACLQCRLDGNAKSCNHNSFLLPQWSSSRKRKIINIMMADQEELLNREIGGIASSLHQKAFPLKILDQFKNLPRETLPEYRFFDHFFVAVDPSGAGKTSDFAIMSMVRYNGLFVIIGMESFPTKIALENHQLIVEHVESIRANSKFANSMAIFILENNLGMESEHINIMLQDNMSNFLVMTERDDDRHIGFRTTNKMKTMAVESVREKILDGCLRLTDNNNIVSVTSTPQEMVPLLFHQMEDFAEVLKESDIEKPRKFYSGKASGKDDLIITLLLVVHWSSFFLRSSKYSHFH